MQNRIISFVFLASMLSACSVFDPYDYGARGASVVSATRGGQAYVSSGRSNIEYASYISALEEAKKEETMGQKQVLENTNPVDDFVESLALEETTSSRLNVTSKQEAATAYMPSTQKVFSNIWGKPVGSVVDGITLVDSKNRMRFNDALTTTPVRSQVRWQSSGHSFIFMPNSAIFQPFYSGGNCRDGVFVHYGDGLEERVRGLFCQKGVGADWYLIQ